MSRVKKVKNFRRKGRFFFSFFDNLQLTLNKGERRIVYPYKQRQDLPTDYHH